MYKCYGAIGDEDWTVAVDSCSDDCSDATEFFGCQAGQIEGPLFVPDKLSNKSV